ncbi:hypothetical protein D3C75_811340 [compost metagenome]
MIAIPVRPVPGKGPGIHIYGKHVTESVHQIFSRFMNSNRTTCEYYKAREGSGAFFQGGFDDPTGEFVFIEFWQGNWMNFRQLLKRRLNLLDNAGNPLPITVQFNQYDTKAHQEVDLIHNYMEGHYQPMRKDEGYMTYLPKDGQDALYVIEMIELKKEFMVLQRKEIQLDPYEWEEKGSLTVCEMIEEDTGVPYIWNLGEELRFLPTNEEELHKVMDHLMDFKIPFVTKSFGYE